MNTLKLVAASLIVMVLAACAAPPQPGEQEVRYGKVVSIDQVSLEGDSQIGIGSIIGAVAGGVLGHQIGSGSGQDVATVAGVLGGAYAGNKVQNKYADRKPGQYIVVALKNGVTVGVTQPADPTLQVGATVRIDGSGQSTRVVRR